MFQRQLIGDDLVQSLLRTGLELKQLSLQSPRQLAFLLVGVASPWRIDLVRKR
jgi:ubiquinone biosynthesis protein